MSRNQIKTKMRKMCVTDSETRHLRCYIIAVESAHMSLPAGSSGGARAEQGEGRTEHQGPPMIPLDRGWDAPARYSTLLQEQRVILTAR